MSTSTSYGGLSKANPVSHVKFNFLFFSPEIDLKRIKHGWTRRLLSHAPESIRRPVIPLQGNRLFHPSEVVELVADLSGECKALTCPSKAILLASYAVKLPPGYPV